jgi:anaerobic magnesium-protoporphyrin IX monomethyl ester cyclase
MPDILLIQPPIQDFYLTAKRTMPYGLACVAGALRQSGFSTTLIDGLATDKSRAIDWPDGMDYLRPFYGRPDRSPFALFHAFRHFGYSLEHICRQARGSGAFLIGISSLFSAYSHMALETAAAVKQVCPRAVIVMGGHHPTAMPEAVMQHPAVDYVLRGDGEVGMPLLARAIQEGTSVQAIPGLVWRQADGNLNISAPTVFADLDRLPMPALDLIDWRFYRRAGRGSLALSASRGCPLRCTYCAVNASTFHGYRRRSVSAVMAEVAAADALAPIGFIDFEDEHLSADRKWFMDLLAALEQRHAGRVELRAMNGLLASSLEDEMVAAMGRAGFKVLNLALITTSVGQLKRFGRPDMTADIDRILSSARAHGLSAVAYLIVAGPGQDPLSSVNDLLFLARRRVLAGVSVFYPAPGSADYRWCERHSLLPAREGLLRATALPLAHATDRIQAVTLMRLSRILNFMKQIVDDGLQLPAPAPAPEAIDPQTDRVRAGRILLAAFLHNGEICGLDLDGKVYRHACDPNLVHAFISGLGRIEGSRA